MRSPRLAAFLLLAGLGAIPALTLEAQGSIRGVVYDSLSADGPVANALVTVQGTSIRARTDWRGRFEIDSLPAGRYILTHHGLWLDSLALPALSTTVDLYDGGISRVQLTTPGPAAYHLAVCGARFPLDRGLLRGEVRDADGAPAAGVFVAAIWSEAVLRRDAMSGELLASVDTTDASGGYALCGVPRESRFMLRAGDDTVGTDFLAIDIGASFASRLDLVIGDRTRRARVIGRVVDVNGAPIARAVITMPSGANVVARTDSSGRFQLEDVPQRSGAIIVRTLGFIPEHRVVEPASGDVELPDIVLQVVPYSLDTVRVTGARTLEELAFLERREIGRGVSIDQRELARYPQLTANALQTFGYGIRTSGGAWPRVMLRNSIGTCFPVFFMDGFVWGRTTDGAEEQMLLRDAKRIEVFRVIDAPASYTDLSGCGVVLIWTR
jgi:hypothetical protein